jgi:hypothetical protein
MHVHMEFPMKIQLASTALGLVLAAGTTAANAQTVITRQISNQPVETVITQQPVQTVRTVETTRTVRPARSARRQVVTTRRVVTERVVPTVAGIGAQPLYDVASPPLYDAVVPVPPPPVAGVTPVEDDATLAGPVYTAPVANPIPTYRYVYEPDRILVIDPATNIAIQALPR